MASYADTVAGISGGPTTWYRCQETSGSLVDLIGALNGTATGTPTYQVAGPGAGSPYGISLDNGDYFTVADHASIDLGNLFSIVWWERKTSSTNHTVLLKGDNATDPGYKIAHISNLMRLQGGGGGNRVRQTTADTSTLWEMYAVIWNGASSIFQLNGTDDTGISSSTALTDGADSLVIGDVTGGATKELSDIAIWKGAALSDANIQSIYDAIGNASVRAGGGLRAAPNISVHRASSW